MGGRGREKGALVRFKEAGERVHASTARAIYVFPQRPLRGCQWMTQHWRGSREPCHPCKGYLLVRNDPEQVISVASPTEITALVSD